MMRTVSCTGSSTQFCVGPCGRDATPAGTTRRRARPRAGCAPGRSDGRLAPSTAVTLEIARNGNADVLAPRCRHDLHTNGELAVGRTAASDDDHRPTRTIEHARIGPTATRCTTAAGA